MLVADPRLAMVAMTMKGCGLVAIWVQMVLQCTQVPLNHLYPMHPSLSPVTGYIALHLGGGGCLPLDIRCWIHRETPPLPTTVILSRVSHDTVSSIGTAGHVTFLYSILVGHLRWKATWLG